MRKKLEEVDMAKVVADAVLAISKDSPRVLNVRVSKETSDILEREALRIREISGRNVSKADLVCALADRLAKP